MGKAKSLLRDLVGGDHLRILRSLFLVGLFLLVGKFAGAAKEIAIAYRYGVSEIVDTYILVFTLVFWIPSIWVGLLNSVYVPLIHKIPEVARADFRKQMMGLTFVCAGSSYLLLLIALPEVARYLPDRFTASAIESFVSMSRGLAPLAAIGLIAAQLSVQLLAEEKHANTLSEAIPSFVLMLVILFFPVVDEKKEIPFILGCILGSSLQVMGLFYLVNRHNLWGRPQFNRASPAWPQFWRAVRILGVSGIVMSFINPICSLIAANLGEGNVAKLGYSSRVLALFLTLGSVAVSRAVLPVLSSTAKSEAQRVRLAVQWFFVLLVTGILFAIICWFASPTIVKLLLQRGEFTAADASDVIEGVQLGVFQFPFYFSGIVLVQLYASLGLYRSILISSCIALVVKVTFALVFAKIYSFAGIVLASTPMYLCTSVFFVWSLSRRNKLSKQLG